MKKVLALLVVGVLVVPLAGRAAVFLAEEDSNKTSGPIEGDLFIAGNTATVEHAVRDDIFAAGGAVFINEGSGGDVFAAGNSVAVEGNIDDDVLAGGRNVRIMVDQVDDVMAAGAVVEIDSPKVDGSVYVGGQIISISGSIAGSVRAVGEEVTIKSGTTIGGDLITYGESRPVVEEGVTVGGETRHELTDAEISSRSRVTIGSWVMSVFTWFVVGLVLLYLFRSTVEEVAKRTLEQGGKALGIGFLAALLILPAIILLLITVLAWPLAILIALFSTAHLMLAYALTMIVVGIWALRHLFKKGLEGKNPITWQHLLLGVVLVKIIQLLPVIGGLAVFVATIMVWGALLQTLWSRLRGSNHIPVVPEQNESSI